MSNILELSPCFRYFIETGTLYW